MRRGASLLLIGVIAGALAGPTLSAFSSQTDNTSNSLQAATSFMQAANGTYAGNGTSQSITVGFQPDLVIIKGNIAQVAVARTSTMTGDATKPLSGATVLTASMIQSLTANGFTVGNSNRVNGAGTNYYWMAFKATSGYLKVSSYPGNGTSQAITGLGFSPEYVAVFAPTAQRAVQRYSGMTRAFQFDADTGTTTRITSLDANGFSVGSSAEVNSSGQTYHYVAWNDVPGYIDASTYVGNGVNDRDITGVGFQPDYVMIRANDTATARNGQHRPSSLTGTGSLFMNNLVNITTGIKALNPDGFRLGTNAAVNASGPTYHYIAFKSN